MSLLHTTQAHQSVRSPIHVLKSSPVGMQLVMDTQTVLDQSVLSPTRATGCLHVRARLKMGMFFHFDASFMLTRASHSDVSPLIFLLSIEDLFLT